MITLIPTCSACPEQYDAFCDDRQVGYLRPHEARPWGPNAVAAAIANSLASHMTLL